MQLISLISNKEVPAVHFIIHNYSQKNPQVTLQGSTENVPEKSQNSQNNFKIQDANEIRICDLIYASYKYQVETYLSKYTVPMP